MEKDFNTGIKELLKKYPSLAKILQEYDINCSECTGNCLSKNIFEEHNLSMKEEMELVSKMKKVLE
jgi:hypothetical protein